MLTLAAARERQRQVDALVAEDRPVRLRITNGIVSATFAYRERQVADVPRRIVRGLLAGGSAVETDEEPTVRPATCCGLALAYVAPLDGWLCSTCGRSWA